MDGPTFVRELEAFKKERLAPIARAGRTSIEGNALVDDKKMLQIALANEISVSELAAVWVPSTPEIDVKLAFAQQAGDEASHFQLVADRLSDLGFDLETFRTPRDSPLFQYLRGLASTVERIAAGAFPLSIFPDLAHHTFIAVCACARVSAARAGSTGESPRTDR